jgi:hypothetical protein
VRSPQNRWRVVYRPPIRYFAALSMTVEKFWWTVGDLGRRDIIALVILQGAEVRSRQKRWRVVYRPPIRYFAALSMTIEKF